MQKLFSQEIRFKDDDGNDFPDWRKGFGLLSYEQPTKYIVVRPITMTTIRHQCYREDLRGLTNEESMSQKASSFCATLRNMSISIEVKIHEDFVPSGPESFLFLFENPGRPYGDGIKLNLNSKKVFHISEQRKIAKLWAWMQRPGCLSNKQGPISREACSKRCLFDRN